MLRLTTANEATAIAGVGYLPGGKHAETHQPIVRSHEPQQQQFSMLGCIQASTLDVKVSVCCGQPQKHALCSHSNFFFQLRR